MSTTLNTDIYGSLGLSNPATTQTKKKDVLDQADFMRLMTSQLQHQDPLKPMDNSQMVAQMAQLSTVQGINNLNASVQGFQQSMSGDQILRGAALVGHEVLVPSSKLALEEAGTVSGTVAAPGPGFVTVDITDANGIKVNQISVEAGAGGEVAFQWDGTDADGKRMPAGSYNLSASHTGSSGEQSKLNTYVQAAVESVTVGTDGLYLNLKGLGTAPLDYVLRIS
ncbi:MAG: flagellar hook capping FlgD N-terminal domain-containing protein [Stenotrophomonas sp.]